MSNMFTNYDNDIKSVAYPPCFRPEPKKGPKLLRNIKGETLGVQIDYASPLQLYFHLENVCDVEIDGYLPGITRFEILTTTHKVLVTQEYKTADILNPFTGDLCIIVPASALQVLKKESYNMRVTLETAETTDTIFAEKDGYLVIR